MRQFQFKWKLIHCCLSQTSRNIWYLMIWPLLMWPLQNNNMPFVCLSWVIANKMHSTWSAVICTAIKDWDCHFTWLWVSRSPRSLPFYSCTSSPLTWKELHWPSQSEWPFHLFICVTLNTLSVTDEQRARAVTVHARYEYTVPQLTPPAYASSVYRLLS